MNADHVLFGMTPDLSIKRCGKPEKDMFDRKDRTRKLYFKQYIGASRTTPSPDLIAVLHFWKDDQNGRWSLQYMTVDDDQLVTDREGKGQATG